LGHVFYSRAWVAHGRRHLPVVVLAPVAVRPDRQRLGIGQALIRESLSRARAAGHSAVSVLGDPAYYPRFGFAPAGNWGIEAPFSVPPEAFMALELRPGSLAGVAGKLHYAPAFGG
ncbi:MAG: N-acetyltransferase, partial [Bacteroidetes bacterium]